MGVCGISGRGSEGVALIGEEPGRDVDMEVRNRLCNEDG